MKRSMLVAALVMAAAPALAATDLSRPGALDRLRSDKPGHYDAVVEIAKAGSRLTCGPQDLKALRVDFPLDKLDCGFLIMTSNPPQRRLNFVLEGEPYVITVFLRDTAPRLIGSRAF